MSKFDMGSIAAKIQKKFEKKNPKRANRIGAGTNLKKLTPEDFIQMPQWWKDATNTPGLPFGAVVMLAGDSDSGKTSAAIQAMNAALAQGVGVIYVETEKKTTEKDLLAWGVDPNQVLIVQSSIAEEAFELMFEAWDGFMDKYAGCPLLVIFDSLGNVVSQRDADIDLTESSQKPGGKGATNRLGINKMIAKMQDDNVAVLFCNYTYDNIGSPGKTNAGGKAVNFFSSLTYQTTRKKWAEKTVKGVTKRVGAVVRWKLFKNHIDKSNPGPKVVDLEITSEGIRCLEATESAE